MVQTPCLCSSIREIAVSRKFAEMALRDVCLFNVVFNTSSFHVHHQKHRVTNRPFSTAFFIQTFWLVIARKAQVQLLTLK